MLNRLFKRIRRRRPFTVYGGNGKVYHFKTAAAAYNFIHH